MNFNDVTIVSIKRNDCIIYFWYMSNDAIDMQYDDAIDIMKNSDLHEKTYYYERNKEVILNRAKEYYNNNKEVLREKARNKYRELSENEKDIKREYGRNRYKNMSKENKITENKPTKRLRRYQNFS